MKYEVRMNKNTKNVIASIVERALKTFAQAFIPAYPAVQGLDVNALGMALQIGASAAILSIFTSVASMKFGKNGPSLANETILPEEVAGH